MKYVQIRELKMKWKWRGGGENLTGHPLRKTENQFIILKTG